jgi:hypothetical protein
MARLLRERNRLVDAYVSRIRVGLLGKCSAGELPQQEAALRRHLAGHDPSREARPARPGRSGS